MPHYDAALSLVHRAGLAADIVAGVLRDFTTRTTSSISQDRGPGHKESAAPAGAPGPAGCSNG